MNYHYVEPTITPDGVELAIKCSAPEGAECRLWCDEGCDTYPGDHHGYHELHDVGYCTKIEGWLDHDIEGTYVGDVAPLRKGPIDLIWEGDYYTWKYSPEAPDGAAALCGDCGHFLSRHTQPGKCAFPRDPGHECTCEGFLWTDGERWWVDDQDRLQRGAA